MAIPTFSRPPTTTITAAPKTAFCSGIVDYANDSGFVTTAEHGYTNESSPPATHALAALVADPTHSRTNEISSETPVRVTDDQRLASYSSLCLCHTHQSGEVWKKCRRSHLCTGHLRKAVPPAPPPNAVQQTSDWTNHSPPPVQPGPGASDNDSDPDSNHAVTLDSPWHPMDGHSGSQLASFLHYSGVLDFPSYSMGSDQPEIDHGYSHTSPQPHDPLQEPAILWGVQESGTQRPEEQELVVAKPLKLMLTPNQIRESFHDERHVYARPFVCNMPELQPNFVGEMRSEY